MSSFESIRRAIAITCLACAFSFATSPAFSQTAAPPTKTAIDYDAIPAGYERAPERKVILSIAACLFTFPYVASAIDATTGYRNASENTTPRGSLWIPAAGPFIMMARGASASSDVLLTLDGVAQIAGISLFAYGLTWPRLVPITHNDAAKITIAPILTPSISGAMILGTF
jgi:hypothetical protein